MVSSPLFRLGRALFGGLLAFVAVDGLRTLDERTGDAEPKGVPFPNVSVPAVGTALAFLRIGRRTETATRGPVPSTGGRPRRADRFVPVSGPFLTA